MPIEVVSNAETSEPGFGKATQRPTSCPLHLLIRPAPRSGALDRIAVCRTHAETLVRASVAAIAADAGAVADTADERSSSVAAREGMETLGMDAGKILFSVPGCLSTPRSPVELHDCSRGAALPCKCEYVIPQTTVTMVAPIAKVRPIVLCSVPCWITTPESAAMH